MVWPWGGCGCGRLKSADQKAPRTSFQQRILGLQVRLVLQQLGDIEADAVLGFAPADVVVGELRAARIAHGLLQHLFELCFAILSSVRRLAYARISIPELILAFKKLVLAGLECQKA